MLNKASQNETGKTFLTLPLKFKNDKSTPLTLDITI